MAQSADAVFMPVEQQSYDVLLSIGLMVLTTIFTRNAC